MRGKHAKPWINATTRMWIYRVALALVAIFVGFTSWDAVTDEQWTRLIEAVLGLGVMGGLNVASAHITPDPVDTIGLHGAELTE